MKVDITPSELKDLIKIHEVDKNQAVRQYEQLEDACLSYRAYRKNR